MRALRCTLQLLLVSLDSGGQLRQDGPEASWDGNAAGSLARNRWNGGLLWGGVIGGDARRGKTKSYQYQHVEGIENCRLID